MPSPSIAQPDPVGTAKRVEHVQWFNAEVGYRQELMGWGHADVMATYYQADSRTQTNTPFLNHAPYIYSFLGKVSLTRGVFKGLTVGGGMRKQGSFLELAGAVANAWPVTGTAFASYTFHDRWVAHLNVDNITNARYIITGTSLAEGNDPRRFRFGVSYKW